MDTSDKIAMLAIVLYGLPKLRELNGKTLDLAVAYVVLVTSVYTALFWPGWLL